MPLGDGQIIGARFPIAGKIIGMLGPAVLAAIESGDPAKLEDAVKANPEVKNNLNLESPLQSGVTVTTTGGALGLLLFDLGLYLVNGSLDTTLVGATVMAELAFVGTLIRRWVPGLAPLFSKGK